jgi:hypothetical protein
MDNFYRVRLADDTDDETVSGPLRPRQAAQLYVSAIADRARVASTTVTVVDEDGVTVGLWAVRDGAVTA